MFLVNKFQINGIYTVLDVLHRKQTMPLSLKIFFFIFIKTNWRAFTKQANCSGSLRSSKLSFMFPSCCIWRNKGKIRQCHLLLLHPVVVSRSKVCSQAKGGTIRKRQQHRKRHWKLTSLFLSIQIFSRLFHSSQVETHFSILLHRRSSSQVDLHLGKFTSLWLRKAKETHKRVSIFGSSFLAVVVSQGRLLAPKKHADLYTYTKIQKPMYKWSGSSWGLVLRFYR